MALELVLPLGKESSTKNLVFSILTKEYPLKLIDLMNLIKKRYGKSVTFQAVRKAVLELVLNGVLVKEGKEFSINKEWVLESKKTIDGLYHELQKKAMPATLDSIGGEVSVFTFRSLNDLMKFWQNMIDDWFLHFKKGDPNVNCWQGAHLWEALLHSDAEQRIMGQLKKKKIISYAVITGNTALDKNILRLYKKVGLRIVISASHNSFDRGYNVGTYGALIMQVLYPAKLVKDLDKFFHKNTTLEKLELQELAKIVNQKMEMKLTVIKNLDMAKQINKTIIEQIE